MVFRQGVQGHLYALPSPLSPKRPGSPKGQGAPPKPQWIRAWQSMIGEILQRVRQVARKRGDEKDGAGTPAKKKTPTAFIPPPAKTSPMRIAALRVGRWKKSPTARLLTPWAPQDKCALAEEQRLARTLATAEMDLKNWKNGGSQGKGHSSGNNWR